MRRRPILTTATLATLVASPNWATAQSSVACELSNGTYELSGARRDYRINVNSLQTLLTHDFQEGAWQENPLNTEHAKRAIIAGADVWAEQTNARAYRYRGTSSLTDLPETQAECQAQGIDYSLVVGWDEDLYGCAATWGKCKDENGVAQQFMIRVARLKDGQVECVFEPASAKSPREFDLQTLMTHEFGHPFGLGHLDDAIMHEVYQNTVKGRDVFHADIECTRQVIGERQTAGYARLVENGTLSNELAYTWLPVANSAVGMGNLAGTPRWTSVSKDTFGLYWLENFVAPSFNRLDQPNEDALSVFTPAVWREQPSVNRVFYSKAEPGRDGIQSVRVRRSVNGFQNEIDEALEECTNSTGFLSCSTSQPVQSAARVAVAWDDYNSRSVTAWIRQDRSQFVNEVRVSVGMAGDALLPQSSPILVSGQPLTSTVAPGLVCKMYEADNYDCMLAVVPGDDPLRRVTIYRFWVNESGSGHTLHVDPNATQLSASTGSKIAAWYHDGEFWLAYRTMYPGQYVQVMRSANSVDWTAMSSNAVDPSAMVSGNSFQ